MKVEDVLSEILGVPCGNVKFHREGVSRLLRSSEYLHSGVHSSVTYRIHFSSLKRIPITYPENIFGSVWVSSQDWFSTGESPVQEFGYTAYLNEGKETERIVRAVANELSCY